MRTYTEMGSTNTKQYNPISAIDTVITNPDEIRIIASACNIEAVSQGDYVLTNDEKAVLSIAKTIINVRLSNVFQEKAANVYMNSMRCYSLLMALHLPVNQAQSAVTSTTYNNLTNIYRSIEENFVNCGECFHIMEKLVYITKMVSSFPFLEMTSAQIANYLKCAELEVSIAEDWLIIDNVVPTNDDEDELATGYIETNIA